MRINSFLAVVSLLLSFVSLGVACGGGGDENGGSGGEIDTTDDTTADDSVDDGDLDDDADDDTSGDDTNPDDDSMADDDTTTDDDTMADDDTAGCDLPAHDAFIVQGKDFLGQGDPSASWDAFADAHDLCPDSADAEMGMLLADTLWYMGWVKTWGDLSIGTTPLAAREGAAASDGEKSDGTVLQKILRYSFLPMNREIFALADDLIINHPGVQFVVPTLPLWVDQENVVLDMGGEWDIADVWNLRAYAGAFEGIERVVVAFDLDFDWAGFISLDPPPGATPEELVHFYSGYILSALDNPGFPEFLALLAGGATDLSASGVAFGHAFRDINQVFEMIKKETDPQADDVIGYVDSNVNGRWDEAEPYRLPIAGELTIEQNEFLLGFLLLAEDLGLAFLDSGPDDPNPLWPNWFDIADLNFLLIYFQLIDPVQPLPHLPVPIGAWFYNPTTDGFREAIRTLAQALYDATTPP